MSEQAWSDPTGVERARDAFRAAFGAEAEQVWASPGRVNLVGEHTDYNGGLALPIALPHRTFAAITPRRDSRVRLVSALGAEHRWEGTLDEVHPGGVTGWVAYCLGPAWALRQEGVHLPGFDLALASCVPAGAGLSSSAAVECAVALALAGLTGEPHDDDAARARLAALCVRAENEVAGAPTGGMDQASSLRARAGHALLLHCRDESIEHVPLDLDSAGLALLVMDTRVHHSLADGQYGRRRATCEAAAARLGVRFLGDLDGIEDEEGRDAALSRLEGEEAARARHVLTEIARVTEVVEAARAQDWARMGAAMDASHESLRVDYEVSCVELDVAVAAARSAGALGARMTGGGFGGSAIALVPRDLTDQVVAQVEAAAREHALRLPEFHLVLPSASGERVA